MASFFYADIKTDELQVHGHSDNMAGQIELFDGASSNIFIIKAPASIAQSNISITLPSTVSNTNSLMMNTDGTGNMALITPSGDISMANYGQFTVNGISNTSTITSYSNIIMDTNKRLEFRDANNFITSNSTGDMLIKSDSGNIFITATGEVVILSKSNGTVKIINEGVNELGFIVEQPNTYINFGGTTGSSGYGIRDNNGVLQVKNRIDSNVHPYEWSNIAARLDNLQDVLIASPSNGQVLNYNAGLSKWVNSNGAGQLGYYGSFYDTTTQTSAGLTSANPMKLNTTAEAHGVSIYGTSNIKVDYAGVYNIQFSAQLENTSSGTHQVDIWLGKNGTNSANTDTKVSLVGNNSKNVAAWNFVLSLNANDYVTLYWASTTSNNIQLTAESASIDPVRPAVPSLIVSVVQVMNIQDGTQRLGDLINVNDTAKGSNSLIQYNSSLNQWVAVSNITLDTGNKINLGPSSNISYPATGNLTIQNNSNIDLVVPNGNEVHVHNNLRVTGTLYMDGNNNSNISAPTASNLDLNAGNVNLFSTNQLVAKVAGTQIFTANYVGSNSIINMGSVSGESGIGFKNTAGNQIQVKPNSSAAWTNMVTHLSNCGDVTISSPANTNALIYNSGTSTWTNRQIQLNDISQVSVSSLTSNQALFYNGTDFINRSAAYSDLSGNAIVIPFSNNSVRLCANAGAGGQASNCIAIGNLAASSGTQQNGAIAIGTNAGSAGQSTGSIAIGQSAGSTAEQQGGAIAIGQSAGSAGQGVRSIAIGTAAHLSGVQPNYSMVLNASSSTVNAAQASSTYIAPLRNVNTSNVVMYNNSTKEITYGSRDYYTLTMWGALNNTYASSTGTLKFLFTLDATYWDTAPNASASPPSLTQFSSGAITYNTSNGIIELNSAKNYYMDLDVQMSVNYPTTATMFMELVKNPVTSNTILCTSKLEASASVDYVYFTLPMKTIIQTASNIRINVYKATSGTTATDLNPDCQISMLLQEI